MIATNQHTIGIVQVINGRTFSQEFGVGENLKFNTAAYIIQYGFNRLGCAYRKR